MKASNQVYKMLAFQYKPIEKHIKSHVRPEDWEKYQKLPTIRKIVICDKWANMLGL